MSTEKISIVYKGIPLAVEYDYQPFERPKHDYPGCDEDIEITSVKHCGGEIGSLFVSTNDHPNDHGWKLKLEILEQLYVDRQAAREDMLADEWMNRQARRCEP